MSHILAAIIAAIIAATAAASIIVAVIVTKNSPSGPRPPTSVAAPGPVAGVGLPAIALVGGYLWLVRRKKRQ